MKASLQIFTALVLLGGTVGTRALDLDGLVKNSPFGQAPEKLAIG
ncbi:hypothetical protein EMGBD4_05910, partial [Verrucomicrobiota bacterium]